jgi:integrase
VLLSKPALPGSGGGLLARGHRGLLGLRLVQRRRSWGRVREKAGLEAVRFHDIRHTCVSLLLDLGVAPHIVRDIVGHSDIEVTMTIYAHAALGEKRRALGKLGDALG